MAKKLWTVPAPAFRAALKACLGFCSQPKECKPPRTQVYLDANGGAPVMVATNGHTLITVDLKIPGELISGGLEYTSAKALLKHLNADKSKGTLLIVIETNDNRIKVGPYDLPVHNTKFPPWRNVMPTPSRNDGPAFHVSPWYLETVAKTARQWAQAFKMRQGDLYLTVHPGSDALDPILCTVETVEGDLTMVVMPMRGD